MEHPVLIQFHASLGIPVTTSEEQIVWDDVTKDSE